MTEQQQRQNRQQHIGNDGNQVDRVIRSEVQRNKEKEMKAEKEEDIAVMDIGLDGNLEVLTVVEQHHHQTKHNAPITTDSGAKLAPIVQQNTLKARHSLEQQEYIEFFLWWLLASAIIKWILSNVMAKTSKTRTGQPPSKQQKKKQRQPQPQKQKGGNNSGSSNHERKGKGAAAVSIVIMRMGINE